MASARKQRYQSLKGCLDGRPSTTQSGPNSVDKLAFKYMEMCKVDSSTDSESDISPRWSETSAMGYVSSTPESGSVQKTMSFFRKTSGRPYHSQSLDPYDGSSEDSDESSRALEVLTRRQRYQGGGGFRFSGRSGRRLTHQSAYPALQATDEVKCSGRSHPQYFVDVQMKSGSDSELYVCKMDNSSLRESTYGDECVESGAHSRWEDSRSTTHCISGSLPQAGMTTLRLPDKSSERSPDCPCPIRSLSKRKPGLLGAEVGEWGYRKRLCVSNIQDGGNRLSVVN